MKLAPGSPAKDVADLTGSEPIVFGYRSPATTVFGYPAEAPYNGAKLDYCSGKVLADPYGAADAGVRCAMTEGGSGGPWLSDFDPATGSGFITGVTSFKYAGAQRVVYSADLGAVAQGPLHPRRKGLTAYPPVTTRRSGGPGQKSAQRVRPPAEWVDRGLA